VRDDVVNLFDSFRARLNDSFEALGLDLDDCLSWIDDLLVVTLCLACSERIFFVSSLDQSVALGFSVSFSADVGFNSVLPIVDGLVHLGFDRVSLQAELSVKGSSLALILLIEILSRDDALELRNFFLSDGSVVCQKSRRVQGNEIVHPVKMLSSKSEFSSRNSK